MQKKAWRFSSLKTIRNFKAFIEIEAKDKTTAAINRINEKFSTLNKLDSYFVDVDKRLRPTLKALEHYQDRFQALGNALTKSITLPFVALGVAGVKFASDFQKEMLKAQVATRGELFPELRKKAILEALRTQYSPSEVAQSIQYLGRGGVRSNEILDMLPATLDLATASGYDPHFAAEGLIAVQNTFGKSSKEMGTIVDKLTVAFTSSTQTFDDLINAISYANVLTKSGQDLDSVLLGTSLLAEKNIKNSRGGTGLAGIFRRLIKPSNEAKDAFDRLKIVPKDIYKDEKKRLVKPLYDLIQLFKKKNATSKDLTDIFQDEGGNAMMALTELPNEKIEFINDQIKNKWQGRAEAHQKANTSGVFNKTKILFSSLQTLSTTIFEDSGFLKKLEDWIDKATTLVNNFNNSISGKTDGIRNALIGGGVLASLGVIFLAFAKLIGIISLVSRVFGGTTVLLSLCARLTVVGAALSAVGFAIWAIIRYWDDISNGSLNFIRKISYWLSDISKIIKSMPVFKILANPLASLASFLDPDERQPHPFYKQTEKMPWSFDIGEYGQQVLRVPSADKEKKQIEIIFKNLPAPAVIKEQGTIKGISLNLGNKMGALA